MSNLIAKRSWAAAVLAILAMVTCNLAHAGFNPVNIIKNIKPAHLMSVIVPALPVAPVLVAQTTGPGRAITNAVTDVVKPVLPAVGAAANEVARFTVDYAKVSLDLLKERKVGSLGNMADPTFFELVAGIHAARQAGLIHNEGECNNIAQLTAQGAAAYVGDAPDGLVQSLGTELGQRACNVENRLSDKAAVDRAANSLPVSLPPGMPQPPMLSQPPIDLAAPQIQRVGISNYWIGGCTRPDGAITLIRSDWHVWQFIPRMATGRFEWIDTAYFMRDPTGRFFAIVQQTAEPPGPVYAVTNDGAILVPNGMGMKDTGMRCSLSMPS
jgi:hypothetical protein